MARNDEWCEFCEEKMKQATVKVNEMSYDICYHCHSLHIDGGTKE